MPEAPRRPGLGAPMLRMQRADEERRLLGVHELGENDRAVLRAKQLDEGADTGNRFPSWRHLHRFAGLDEPTLHVDDQECRAGGAERQDLVEHCAPVAVSGHGRSLPWRRVEGAPQVAQHRFLAVRDLHHVEPAADVVEAAPLQIAVGETHEAALLLPGDGSRGRVIPTPPSRLHLDEHPDVTVATDEIDLTAGKAHVALDHPQPRPLQRDSGASLPVGPNRASRVHVL
jgi:hypothetical protein